MNIIVSCAFHTHLANPRKITGKTRVLYSELGEITGKTRVLPRGYDLSVALYYELTWQT